VNLCALGLPTLLALPLALVGCAATPVSTPRSRVARDLGCSTEATAVTKLEALPGDRGARWHVSGCGRTAVYLCTAPVRDCWRQGEIEKDP
jgi:hypothetical protein